MIYNQRVGPCLGILGRLFGHRLQSQENLQEWIDVNGSSRTESFNSYAICPHCGVIVSPGNDDDDDDGDDGDGDGDNEVSDLSLPVPDGEDLRVT